MKGRILTRNSRSYLQGWMEKELRRYGKDATNKDSHTGTVPHPRKIGEVTK